MIGDVAHQLREIALSRKVVNVRKTGEGDRFKEERFATFEISASEESKSQIALPMRELRYQSG